MLLRILFRELWVIVLSLVVAGIVFWIIKDNYSDEYSPIACASFTFAVFKSILVVSPDNSVGLRL